jgi:hypothetical protein
MPKDSGTLPGEDEVQAMVDVKCRDGEMGIAAIVAKLPDGEEGPRCQMGRKSGEA